KPFSCENRDKSFCIRYQLTRHRLSHSGEKPAHQTPAEPQWREAINVSGCRMLRGLRHTCQHEDPHGSHSPAPGEALEDAVICYLFCFSVGYGKDFKKNNQLKTHKTEHAQPLPFQLPLCCGGLSPRGDLVSVSEAKEGCTQSDSSKVCVCSVKLQCDGCSRMFLEAWFLQQHQLWVHKREFRCSKTGCGKTFTTHFNLENHVMSDHKGQKAFSCTHVGCGKSFAMQVSTL
ncbi:unnamed protein product, partial [Coregonus sp. 'balchen']